jgi:glycosyltransferase involved in cell wall biosynthesis
MAQRSALALAKNNETLRLLERAGAREPKFLLDCGLPPDYAAGATPQRSREGPLRLLWAGRLEQRKAPRLALEAIAKVRESVHLTIAGDGPLRAEMDELVRDLGIADRAQLIGSAPYTKMAELFRQSHALLFTSLRDSTGCVVLEAMAHGLPIVMLDHQGVACFVPDDAAMKVAVTTPAETLAALTNAIEQLARSPERREQLGARAIEAARTHTWDRRAKMIAGWYRDIVEAARAPQPQSQSQLAPQK